MDRDLCEIFDDAEAGIIDLEEACEFIAVENDDVTQEPRWDA